MTLTYGIDISHWQGTADWAKVGAWRGADGGRIAFVILKASEGYDFEDGSFAVNAKALLAYNATAAGKAAPIFRCAYHMLRHNSAANSDAQSFIRFVKGTTVAPVWPDIENVGLAVDIESGDVVWSDVLQFAAQFRAALPGHPLGAYWPDWEYGRIGSPPTTATLFDWFWRAGANSHYVGLPANGSHDPAALAALIQPYYWVPPVGYGWSSVDVSQYTDQGRVPGIGGGTANIDCNVTKRPLDQFQALVLGGNPLSYAETITLLPGGPRRFTVAAGATITGYDPNKPGQEINKTVFAAASAAHADASAQVDWPGVVSPPSPHGGPFLRVVDGTFAGLLIVASQVTLDPAPLTYSQADYQAAVAAAAAALPAGLTQADVQAAVAAATAPVKASLEDVATALGSAAAALETTISKL